MARSAVLHLRPAILCALAGAGTALAILVSCSAAPTVTPPSEVCTPKAYVPCTCQDRSRGTKLCQDDGKSFDTCMCDGKSSSGSPVNPIFDDAGIEEVDSGHVDAEAPKIDNACKGKIAVVAGANADGDIYAASYEGGGAFKVVKSTGPGLRSSATVVPVLDQSGSPLLAVWLTKFTLLASMTYTAGSWSAPESIGLDDPAMSLNGPSLTRLSTKMADLGFLGSDGVNYERTYDTTKGWNEDGGVRAIDGGVAGSKGLAIAGLGADTYAAYLTVDNAVVVLKGPNWTGPVTTIVPKNGAYPAAPALVALEGSDTKDLVVVFVGNDQTIRYSVRTSSTKKWSTPASISPSANPLDDLSAAAMPLGQAVVAWRGTNKHGYTSHYDTTNDTWSAPGEIDTGGASELASPPIVTTGRCASAVATVAYAIAGGGIGITRYTKTTAQAYPIGGIPKADWVGVGEAP